MRLGRASCGALAFIATFANAQFDIGGGLRIDLPAMSLQELRDHNVVKQQLDFSCGAAALATILRYGFGEDVSEEQILRELYGLLSDEEQANIRETGFSLLNLQQVAQARGYRAAGFRLQPDQLAMLNGPVIVFIEPRGYRHFAVLRGFQGNRAFLADPSRGNVRMPAYRFIDDWLQDDGNGIIFVVEPVDGLPAGSSVLGDLDSHGGLPEVISAREMLWIGNPTARWPELARDPVTR